jgi:hypothetical protein
VNALSERTGIAFLSLSQALRDARMQTNQRGSLDVPENTVVRRWVRLVAPRDDGSVHTVAQVCIALRFLRKPSNVGGDTPAAPGGGNKV